MVFIPVPGTSVFSARLLHNTRGTGILSFTIPGARVCLNHINPMNAR